jgi:hypothetical protein
VLHRKIQVSCNIYYSLTKEFKDSLDKQKEESPSTYVEDTLSLPQFIPERDDGKAIEFINPSENEESLKDEKAF